MSKDSFRLLRAVNNNKERCKMFGEWWRKTNRFCLFPRRLHSFYWDDVDNVPMNTMWWQWGTWVFWITKRKYTRTFYSNWNQLCSASDHGDADAKVMLQCLYTLQTHKNYLDKSPAYIYAQMIKFT